MADLATQKSNLDSIEGQLDQYTSELPSQIESELNKAYSPLLKESTGVTRDLMGDYLGRYFDTTSMGEGMAGTTAYDLSPSQKLGVMGRELGTMAGDLQATQQYSDYLGAQLNDLYGKAVQAAQLGQQNLADQYSRAFSQYQLAWQENEAEKDRALQREMARLSGGGGGGGIDLSGFFDQGTGTPTQTKTPTAQDQLSVIKQMANSLADFRRSGQSKGGKYSLNGKAIGTIDDAHRYIMNVAKQNYGLDLNPEWLWVQLGNSSRMTPTPFL